MALKIALLFADGQVYFLGMILIMMAVLLARSQSRRRRMLANQTWITGAGLIFFSSTPAPIWFYAAWLGALAVWVLFNGRFGKQRPLGRAVAGAVIVTVCVTGLGLELPYWRIVPLEPAQLTRLYVIGDSLSAGTTPNERTWPEIFAADHPIELIDLSRAGETVNTAYDQALKVEPGPAVVILEIGGNDLLGETSPAGFERDLSRLLEQLHQPGKQLVMFELPLRPLGYRFGWIQRRLAAQYNIRLIPKRVLADVIGGIGHTSDGLHLSEKGHRRMADWVWRFTENVFVPNVLRSTPTSLAAP